MKRLAASFILGTLLHIAANAVEPTSAPEGLLLLPYPPLPSPSVELEPPTRVPLVQPEAHDRLSLDVLPSLPSHPRSRTNECFPDLKLMPLTPGPEPKAEENAEVRLRLLSSSPPIRRISQHIEVAGDIPPAPDPARMGLFHSEK